MEIRLCFAIGANVNASILFVLVSTHNYRGLLNYDVFSFWEILKCNLTYNSKNLHQTTFIGHLTTTASKTPGNISIPG